VLTDEAALTSVDMVVVEPAVASTSEGEVAGDARPPTPPRPVVEVRRIAVPDLPVLRDLPEGPFERTVRQPVPFVGEPAGLSAPAVDAAPAQSPAASAKAATAGRTRKAAPPPVLNDVPEDPFERTQRLPGPAPALPDAVAKPPAPRSSPFRMRMSKKPGRNLPVLQEPVLPVPPASVSPKSAVASALPPAAPSPSPSLDIDLPIANGEEARLLQRVRERLTEALRLDAPLFSARTFMRVRSAQSREELIDLVWEIQDHLSHRRRSHKELSSLHEARDLLGLGNTLVAGDESRPDYLDE
jgi:hypothetical protein